MLSKSSYFEFKNRIISIQEKRKIDISRSIEKIWLNSNKIYGAIKIKAMLELEGISISERTVGNYMNSWILPLSTGGNTGLPRGEILGMRI